jgi:GNAT superfamily N-acetyltransferase
MDFEISDDPARLDLDVIHGYLAGESYWARGIPRDVLERAVAGSLNLGAYDGDGRLAGYARVVTDRATFGWVCDLFVVAAYRGRGLGRALVRAIAEHPDLQGLRRLMLATADAHGLYESEGYRAVDPGIYLEIARSPEQLYGR